jgi:hypothetical protein
MRVFSRIAAVVMVGVTAACGAEGRAAGARDEPGTTAPPTLRELATAWSAGQASPRCQDRGPRGEYLGPAGDQYCVWEAPAGRVARGVVSAHVDRRGDLTLLTWERPTDSPTEAARLVDSLGAALTSRGLTARLCGTGEVPAGTVEAVLWESPTVEVHLSTITPPTGMPRLVVMAVAAPNSIPAVGCPGPA